MAIAGATLEHLTGNIGCKTLFITHYPVIASSAERKYPGKVTNLHMGFTEEMTIMGKRTITFLYRLTKGISSGSYGIECARLAGIPEELLERAEERAEHMQRTVQNRGQLVRYVLNWLLFVKLFLTHRLIRTRKVVDIASRLQVIDGGVRSRCMEELRSICDMLLIAS